MIQNMNNSILDIFQAVNGLEAMKRQSWYSNHEVSETIKQEVEELLRYDGLAENEDFFANRVSNEERNDLVGKDIGPYQITHLIGHGGMGSVYHAKRLKPYEQEVALKVADVRLRSGNARFELERQLLADLQHPGVARILDGGVLEDHRPYLVMEYVPGEHIDAYADRHKLRVMERVQLWMRVCEAVAATHERGVIHRDIKPSNILVTETGRVVVVDFGLARRNEGASGLTQTAMLLGTPDYMAPEQAEGKKKPITPAADVYALGAVLYKLLTGRPPFRADSPIELITMTLHDEPISPRRLNQAVSRDLETICLKCLEKEPARRYESSQALLSDLRRLQHGEPIIARPLSWTGRSWRWMKRRPALAASLALLGLTLLISLVVVGSYWRTSNKALQLAKRTTTQQFLNIVDLAKQPAMQRAQADFLSTWVASQEELVRSLDDEPIYLQFLRARHELAAAYVRIGQQDKAKVSAEQLFQEIEEYSQSHYSDELAIEHAKFCMFSVIALQNPDDPQVRCPVIRKAISILNKVPANSPKIEETLGLIAEYRTILAHYEPDPKIVESELNEAHRILAQLFDPKDPQSRIRYCCCKLTIWAHYYNKGQWLQHLDILKKAAELDRQLGKDFPNDPDHRYGTCAATMRLGNTFEWLGDWQRAYDIQLEITTFSEQMRKRNPDTVGFLGHSANCYQVLGHRAYTLGKNNLAETHYSTALQLAKMALTLEKSPHYLMALARILAECPIPKLRDDNRVLELYQEALTQDLECRHVRLPEGLCLLRAGKYQEAKKAIELSLTKPHTDFELAYDHSYLALTLAKLGEHDLARKELTVVDGYRARYPKEIVMMWIYEETLQEMKKK